MHIQPVTTNEFLKMGLSMSANAEVLRHEEYMEWDNTLVEVSRQELNAIADLTRMGLSKPLPNIGITVANWQRVSDMTPASVSMDGRATGEKDRLTFEDQGVPVPIFHKTFTLNKRNLYNARAGFESLETSHIRTAGRVVLNALENMVVNGTALSGTVDGRQIYGYTNYTARQTVTLAASWATPSEDRDITGDVEAMLSKAYTAGFHGPFMLYVPSTYWAGLQADYSTEKGDNTFLERIKAYAGIADVKPLFTLAADNVVLVQMTPDVVSLRVAQDLQHHVYNVEPFQISAMVSAIMTVQVKSDVDGRCGIVHGTLA